VSHEVAAVEKCVDKSPLGARVTLKDRSDVELPLLEWGSPACWPGGSNSNISKDFIVRGMYYAQLVRMFQFFPRVG
jgi:hypothetical protein